MKRLVPLRLHTRRGPSIAARWDSNVPDRCFDLLGGHDRTYPFLLDHVEHVIAVHTSSEVSKDALDVGSGIGFSTDMLRRLGFTALGIDPSRKSIETAVTLFGDRFRRQTVSQHLKEVGSERYDVVLLLMTLHCVADYQKELRQIERILRPNGVLIVTIPHPHRYLQHKDYFSQITFDYFREACFEVPFRVSTSRQHRSRVLFYHRPMQSYLNGLCDSNFSIEQVIEPAESDTARLADILTVVAKKC